jgi:hypothetical protein
VKGNFSKIVDFKGTIRKMLNMVAAHIEGLRHPPHASFNNNFNYKKKHPQVNFCLLVGLLNSRVGTGAAGFYKIFYPEPEQHKNDVLCHKLWKICLFAIKTVKRCAFNQTLEASIE